LPTAPHASADRIVICAGAWSTRLINPVTRLRIPLDTERGYNTTLPKGAFDLKRQLIFGNHGFVMTPLSTGVRVGGAVELGGLDLPPNYARSKSMLEKAATFLPGLKTTGGVEWMGFRPSCPTACRSSAPCPKIRPSCSASAMATSA
jgi:D-amino-acid dehydrogenase